MFSVTFFVAFFNVVLAIVMLLYNWKLNRNILFFSLYLLIVAFTSVLYDTIINGGSAHLLMIMIGNAGPLFFLCGPLFYFFIRGLTDEKKTFSDKDLLHFVPFFLNMIFLIPYLFKPVDYKLDIASHSLQNLSYYMNSKLIFFPIWFSNSVRILSIMTYLIWSASLLRKAYKKNKAHYSAPVGRQYRSNYIWLNMIVLVSLILLIMHMGLTLYFRYDAADMGKLKDDNLFVYSLIFNALFPLIILFNPGILFGFPVNNALNPMIKGKTINPGDNYGHNVLVAADQAKTYSDYFEGLADKINAFILNARPYLNPEFKEEDLSEVFEIPLHHIHFCIKYYVTRNFKKMINGYRIRHAMELLRNSLDYDEETIKNIGYESGFTTYKSFKRSFRNESGQLPDQWIVENT